MKQQSGIEADGLSGQSMGITNLENRSIQQREETLEWISRFAVPEFRRAWREARFSGPQRRFDRPNPGSARSDH